MKKYRTEQLQKLFPAKDLRVLFMQRPDIAILSPEEQDIRWEKHKENLNKFFANISDINALVIEE